MINIISIIYFGNLITLLIDKQIYSLGDLKNKRRVFLLVISVRVYKNTIVTKQCMPCQVELRHLSSLLSSTCGSVIYGKA